MKTKLLQGWNLFTLSILTLILYLVIAWFIQNPAVFITPDEGSKFLQMQSLEITGDRLIYDVPYPGRELDPGLRFAPQNYYWGLRVQDGGLYFGRVPLFGLVTRPFFDLFGFPGLYVIPAISAVICTALTVLLLEPEERRLELWLLLAFGSPLLIYATLFWEHTPAVALGLLAMWLALRPEPNRVIPRWLVIGALLGLSIFLRLEMVIFAVAFIGAFLLIHPRKLGPLMVLGILALFLLIFIIMHQSLFGQPWPANTRFLIRPFVYFQHAGWLAVQELLVGPAEEGAIDTGWLGGLWTIAALVAIFHSSLANQTPALRRLILGGTILSMVVAAWFLFEPTNYYSAHGLLFTTPWALLGLIRTREFWQEGDVKRKTIVATLLLGLAGYTMNMLFLRGVSPHGGLEWGARYAMIYFSLLAIVATREMGRQKLGPLYRLLLGMMIFLGIAFQVRGVMANQQSKSHNAAVYERVSELRDEHIVFNEWWLPLNAAPIYNDHNFYVANNVSELLAWVRLAAENEIGAFTLITTDEALVVDAEKEIVHDELAIGKPESIESMQMYRILIVSNND